ncbi:MAG: hypothetical protein DCC43_10575 [Candidatus Brocadia sp.]|uniref:DUF481 domain-containing protein n=1 Tax=Candidatus Brocadia fulgida TaxID=380242 RepID=A0A0M2UZ13_9BACT|nr:MAG: hypothetical protein BROFUL_00214 [Candidatus Brocadia fulgida]MCC6325228.1 DUF481 domain-containing protein [Candidatus Brocadia sp.]MCE7912415.1 DUF481 domain-containing protein [Candidatus Brocadia sp. AMX3]MBV6518742.1 hypothetical protein [Candidatus Brocadia fulgida]MDG5997939.1 DUF481 domain-containing protein [Candidatus Brocadia sp.]
MQRKVYFGKVSPQYPFSLIRPGSERFNFLNNKRSMLLLPLVFLFIAWVFHAGMSYSDEIKTIDGAVLTGEIINVAAESISLRTTDGTVSDLPLKDVGLVSRGSEICIINRDGKKFSVLRIPKPANFSMNDIVSTKTDALTLQDLGTSTANVVAKASAPETKATSGQPPVSGGDKIVQAEAATVTAPPRTWKGNIDAGVNTKDGNTESTTTHIKGGYANERKRDNIYFDAIALYETVTNNDTDVDEETVNEQRATGKYEYKHSPRLYSFFNQYFEHDELESLNYRSISSPGAGYRFIDKERLKYKAEAGPAYTYERFHGGIIDDYMGLRVGQYLDWLFWKDTKFYAKSEFVESIEDTKDWRVDTGLGVRHNLTKSIAVSLEFLDQYDNTPAEGKEKEDRTFIGSVGYNF